VEVIPAITDSRGKMRLHSFPAMTISIDYFFLSSRGIFWAFRIDLAQKMNLGWRETS
jgi:hypothetical protein